MTVKLGIHARFVAVLAAFVLLSLGTYLALQSWITGSTNDGRVINLAGRQRMLSQRLAKEALMGERDRCAETRTLFERTLRGLIEGDVDAGLPPAASPAIRDQLLAVDDLWGGYVAQIDALMEADGPPSDEAKASLSATSISVLGEMNTAVGMMEAHARARIDRLEHITLGSFLLALLLALLSYLAFRRTVLRRLATLESTMTHIASERDLGIRLPVSGHDELDGIAEAVNTMQARFQEVTAQVRDATAHLREHVTTLGQVAEESRQGLTEQMRALEQVAAAMNEMAASVKQVAESTSTTAEAARKTDAQARSGQDVVNASAEGIRRLATDVDTASAAMARLQKDAADIGGILDIIDGIADQTNLLAVNATIESEHAGEQGRGFAVVAREVRALAHRTQTATHDIQGVIGRVQDGARRATRVMQRGSEQARESVAHATEAGSSLASITTAATEMRDLNTQIAEALAQQSTVAADVHRNLVAVKALADKAAHGGEITARQCERFGALASQLHGLVDELRV